MRRRPRVRGVGDVGFAAKARAKAMARAAAGGDGGPPRRVELRTAGGAEVLARGVRVAAHASALAPWVSRLRLEPTPLAGELVLVDEASGAVAARRRLDRRPNRHA